MTFLMNLILKPFEATAQAVFGAYFKLQSFVFMPIFGLNNGLIPILAYNYGARNRQRIDEALSFSLKLAVGIMCVGTLLFELIPEQLLSLFSASEEMLRIGVPSGVQSMMFSLSNILIQFAINSLGAEVMAASSAGFNIEVMAFYVTSSFGSACTTFVGQNFGAWQLGRCRRVTRISMIQNVLFSACISLGILLFARPLLRIFNQDPAVLDYGVTRLWYILLVQPLNAVIEIISGSMRGYGRSLEPALVSLFGICGVRILWVCTGFRRAGTYAALLAAYPMSWAVTAAALAVLYFAVMLRQWRQWNSKAL